ncbi:MAG: hypothetical protein LJE69_09145 [Thiohalocapsa sp.]|jgi:hypothetical protein|uniref:hypothetical protein n=1 Tax=Thiohalocapsa sp. TaxID=2497641 RepID=UPI0025CB98A6|nr:hypothetical protein [Thiohalocapsa sp.]MCG6941404.1 hypothetical protein [Thiohalocapsa sp.]
MNDHASIENLIEVLMQRFEAEHLTRILALKSSVAAGQPLTDFEQAFLEEVCREAMDSKYLVDRCPEYQPLYARVVNLYHEITTQALANEEQRNRAPG